MIREWLTIITSAILLTTASPVEKAAAANSDGQDFAREALCHSYLLCGKTQSEAKQLSEQMSYATDQAVRGIVLMRRHQYDEALACFSDAVAADPNSPEMYGWQGFCYASMSRHNDALASYSKARDLLPKNPYLYLTMSMTLTDLKRFDEAARNIDEATKIDASDTPLLAEALGCLSFAKEEYSNALDHFNHEIKIEPGRAVAYYNAGRCLIHLYKDDAALDQFTHAIQLDPDNYILHAMRGTLLEHQKKFDAAIAEYNEAQRIAPRYSSAYEYKGDCYLALNDWSKAIEEYVKLPAINSEVSHQLPSEEGLINSERPDSHHSVEIEAELPIRTIRLTPGGEHVYSGAHRARELLPDLVRECFHCHGISIVISPTVQEFVQTRGLSASAEQFEGLGSAGGLYETATKEAVVAEDPGRGWTAPEAADFTPLTMHELGHAYDECIGSPTDHLPFKLLYARDCAGLGEVQRRNYQWYFSQDLIAPSQVFADLFAIIYCGTSSLNVKKDAMARDFPLTYEYVNSVCPKQSASGGNATD